jgi:predicted trehalose synthase
MSSEIDLDAVRAARWFAGKARTITGARTVATPAGGALRIAEIAYASGPPERYLLIAEEADWAEVLRAGDLELRVTDPALLAARGAQRIPSTDQSNTLVTIDDALLVKAYRKLEAGVHPEVELGAALAGSGAPVPRHAGSLHWGDTAIALLQEFVPGAESGWEAPIAAVAAALRAGAGAGGATSEAVLAPYARAGAATGALHAALAERLGTRRDPSAPARWLADATAALREAAALDDAAARAQETIAARLAALGGAATTGPAATLGRGRHPSGGARPTAPLLGRVHGDLHYAQFLRVRAPDRLLIVDLEGDPTAPLADRRRPDTPLRDLAALLRSIDHIGTAGSRRAEWADPGAFIAAASDAAREAYEHATGAAVDRPLLAALELASECRELVYAHRVVPEWLYAPRAGLQRLLQEGPSPS